MAHRRNRTQASKRERAAGRNEEFAIATRTRHAAAARPETPKNRYNRNEFRNSKQRGNLS